MKRVILLAVLSLAAAVAFNVTAKCVYPLTVQEEIRVVPREEIVKFLCLDHRGFAADYFFIKVNLHSGSLMWKPLKFQFDSDWSYGMMDLVTRLDPKYYVAYLFSAMGLIHNFDDVKRVRPIMERGMEIFPASWELPFWLGYDYYVYLEEYELASRYLWQAAQKPGAPRTHLGLLLSVFRKGGAYEQALWVLESMVKGEKDPTVRMVYEKRLVQLKNLILLQKLSEQYFEARGEYPARPEDLVAAGALPALPEDPFGMRYEWDGEKKRVVVGTGEGARSEKKGTSRG